MKKELVFKGKVSQFTAIGAVVLSVLGTDVQAFGKKRPQDPNPNNGGTAPTEPKDSIAYPTRQVAMGKMYDARFMLPDGKTPVDSAAVLPEIVKTEVAAATRKFRVMADVGETAEGGGASQARYVLRAGLTAFEAEIFGYGITFGYRPGKGDIGKGKLTGAEGKVRGKVGLMQMDFHIFDTQRCTERNGTKMCELVAFGKADSHRSQVNADFQIDFGEIKTGGDFVFNDSIAKIFRKIINDAILEMVKNPQTNFNMDWTSTITRLFPEQSRVFLPAGTLDDVVPGNLFQVYDADGMLLGTIKVRDVEFEQSSAVVKDDPTGKILRSIRLGDTVKIKK